MKQLWSISCAEQGSEKYDNIAHDFGSTIIPKKGFCRAVGILYQLVVGASVTQAKTWGNLVTNFSRAGDQADELQNNCLKNIHPLNVPMPILNLVELHPKILNIPLPNPSRQYLITLVGKKIISSHLFSHLPSSSIPTYRFVTGFWCTKSW